MVGPALRRDPCRGAEHAGAQGARRSFTVTICMGPVCWTLQAVGFSLNVVNGHIKHACPALENTMRQLVMSSVYKDGAVGRQPPAPYQYSSLYVLCIPPTLPDLGIFLGGFMGLLEERARAFIPGDPRKGEEVWVWSAHSQQL